MQRESCLLVSGRTINLERIGASFPTFFLYEKLFPVLVHSKLSPKKRIVMIHRFSLQREKVVLRSHTFYAYDLQIRFRVIYVTT